MWLVQVLKSIRRKVEAEIKTTGHTARNKPFSRVVIPCRTHVMATSLMGGHGTLRTINKRYHLRLFSPEEICEWLSIPTTVEAKVMGCLGD